MFTTDKDINRIARGVMDRTLPKPEWTHAAHVAAAVWLIRSPDYDAERDMPDLIRRYNLACGVKNTDTDGYHETITLASIRMASYLLNQLPAETRLLDAVTHLIACGLARPEWILDYWTREALFSVTARRSWVDPDIKALPLEQNFAQD